MVCSSEVLWVCVPGLGGDESWFSLLKHTGRLKGEFKVINWLNGGAKPVGTSECADGSWILQSMVNQISKTVNKSSSRSVLLLHSMGSLVLPFMSFAQNDFDAVILIEGNLTDADANWSKVLSSFSDRAYARYWKMFLADKERWMKRNHIDSAAMIVDPFEAFKRSDPAQIRKLAQLGYELTRSGRIRASYSALSAEKLFIWGEKGEGAASARELALLGERVYEIPNSGHFPMLSAPDQVSEAILEQLSKH